MDIRTHFKPDTYQYTVNQKMHSGFYLEWLAVITLLCMHVYTVGEHKTFLSSRKILSIVIMWYWLQCC